MVGEEAQRLDVVARGEILEGADADVAGGHAGQHGAGQPGLAQDFLTGRHGGKRPRRGHPQGRHGLAHEIFAQHGTQRSPAVATAGKGRAPGSLELDVATEPVPADNLAQQDGAPVAQPRHEMAELVARIGQSDGLGPFRHAVAGQHRHTVGTGQLGGIEPELLRQSRR